MACFLCFVAIALLTACAGDEPGSVALPSTAKDSIQSRDSLRLRDNPCTSDEALGYKRELRTARDQLDHESVIALRALHKRDLEVFQTAAQRFHRFAQQAEEPTAPSEMQRIHTAWRDVSRDLTGFISLIERLWSADGELPNNDYEQVLGVFRQFRPRIDELPRAVYTVCNGASLNDIHYALWQNPGARIVAISSEGYHTCALREDGEAVCWGALPVDKPSGFGDVDFGQTMPPPGERFVAISSGGFHTCGLRKDSRAKCWGAQLGDSTEGYHLVGYGQSSPPEGEVFKAISSGRRHTCALRRDGSPVCWGK